MFSIVIYEIICKVIESKRYKRSMRKLLYMDLNERLESWFKKEGY